MMYRSPAKQQPLSCTQKT